MSWSTFNQALCALRCLYGVTLGHPEAVQRLPCGRRPKKLPLVLSRPEVFQLLSCVKRRKQRMVLSTMYATGMRVSEAVELAVAARVCFASPISDLVAATDWIEYFASL